MRLASATTSDGVCEQDFTLDDIPGVRWSPAGAAPRRCRPVALLALVAQDVEPAEGSDGTDRDGGSPARSPGIGCRPDASDLRRARSTASGPRD